MRLALLCLPALLFSGVAHAGGGNGCLDACTVNETGMSCLDRGLGCDPALRMCIPCTLNLHCQPGGTCAGGICMGVICTDAGLPDVGMPDTGPGDTGPDGGPVDTGPDTGPVDMGPEDTGPDTGPAPDTGMQDAGDAGNVRDALPPVDPSRRIGGGGSANKQPMDEGCGCSATPDPQGGFGAALLLGLLFFTRRRR